MGAWIVHPSLEASLRGRRRTAKRYYEIFELKRFPNKAADVRGAKWCHHHLLAICACQNHFDIWPSPRCLSNDLRVGGTRDRHVQQHHINLFNIDLQKIDCSRSIGSFDYLKTCFTQFFHDCLPQWNLIFHNQHSTFRAMHRLFGAEYRVVVWLSLGFGTGQQYLKGCSTPRLAGNMDFPT